MPLIALIVGVSILLMNEREYLKEGIKMTREEAIELFFKQLTAARVVLDSGFGSNPGENDILYRWEDYCRRRERRTMDEYITPNYKTIGTVEQRKIRELYTSSLLNAFTQQDYLDAIALIGRVIDRLEKLEK